MEYASVYLLDNPYFLDSAYDYYVPTDICGDIEAGDFVFVPFGNANKIKLGLVVSVKDAPERKDVLCKPVFNTAPKKMSLSPEMMGLCFFMKEQTLCTVGDAVRSMVPASAISRLVEIYRASCDTDKIQENNSIDNSTFLLLDYIRGRGSVKFDLLQKKFGSDVRRYLKALCDEGLLQRDHVLEDKGEKRENYISLLISREDAESILCGEDTKYKLRSEKHKKIIATLLESSELREIELRSETDTTSAQIKALCDKGLIKRTEKVVDDLYLTDGAEEDLWDIRLSDEQQEAYEKLVSLAESGEAHGALLYGVTGSGKTSVMLRLIDRMREMGKGVIVLLPEIALTPQTLSIFCSRYGTKVAVIHSALGSAQRYETYKRIREGRVDVVVGTRSAVFAPVHDLGAIIIDEEQEHTYKSDMSPKYHAKDIARYRCSRGNALMLLASATPSIESYKKALDGKYTLLKLKNRYGAAKLPKATVVDMRIETKQGNTSPLGSLLCQRLVETKTRGEQSILFLNRRGYNNFLSCRDCGESIKCPRCSVSMTYHTFGQSYEKGELRCHWCGTRMQMPSECPSCKGVHIVRMGYGTQRIEQELESLMPDAKILRMDADTTVSSSSYEQMLSDFRNHKADILLGTQMVTKGHDFPDVTLVGVILADSSLYVDDYRANERTFAMLTQVIGRAGRASKAGEAIIQTNNPDNECIRLACAQDYESFYSEAISLRRLLRFPPFCDIVLLTLTSTDEKELYRASVLLAKSIEEQRKGAFSAVPMEIYGPFEAPVYKVENKYRMRMVAKCVLNRESRKLFSCLLADFARSGVKGLNLSVDFNPSNL